MQLPERFIERTQALLGQEEFDKLQNALSTESSVSIRVNTDKFDMPDKGFVPVPWCGDAFYLDTRYTFTFDPLFHSGCYYVQEAGSMFLYQALKQYVTDKVVMLDLCAAPGGKSTLARSVLPEGSLLVANEVMRNRSQILAENVIKWGHPYSVVTNNDPADFTDLGAVFDVILTDVPCSGEGMFRKDEVAVEEWSEDNVNMCCERQRRILRDIWPCLKEDGILIYSTCTYNREENEDNVKWIAEELGAEILPVATESDWNITGNLAGEDFPVYRFMPHKTKGEGLFMAVLRKKEGTEGYAADVPAPKSKRKNQKGEPKQPAVPAEMKMLLSDSGSYTFSVDNGVLRAFPSSYESLLQLLKAKLRILYSGVQLAELKGRDWQPSHSLAMSAALDADKYPQVELDYEQSIAYLRREAITLPADTPRGYVLVTYRNVHLGFVKNIGNRANNLYPNEWRIRSGYLPAELKIL